MRTKELKKRLYFLSKDVVITILWMLSVWYKFMNGRFGKKRLALPYRAWWKCITWVTFSILVFRFVLVPFYMWWDKVVNFLNYIIWG